jgi:hypothetical protein
MTPRKSTVKKSDKKENVSVDGDYSVATFASRDSCEVGGRLSEHIHVPKAVKLLIFEYHRGWTCRMTWGFHTSFPRKYC